MLHKKSLSIIALSLLIMVCCKDNVIDSPVNDVSERRISKIITDSENYKIFLYSEQKLMKYESVQNNLTTVSISFCYQDDGKIESEEVTQNGPINEQRLYKYIYDNFGKIYQIECSLKNGNSFKNSGSNICYYNQNNQLTKTIFVSDTQTFTQETQYSYYPNGNTKEKIRYLDGKLYEKVTYEYDDKKNPITTLNSIAFCGLVVNNNNIIKTAVESSLEPNTSQTIINYTYSTDGYPLKCEIVYTDDKNNNFHKTEEYQYN